MAETTDQLRSGFGRLLTLVYIVFAVSAGVRAAYQIATKFSEAPVAYVLSALAAAIYLLAAIAMLRGGSIGWNVAAGACLIEFVGVIGVGALSVFYSTWFPADTVWSQFGAGYGYVPLVLPILGLGWLWHNRRAETIDSPEQTAGHNQR
ncbi:hypothetical protein [Natronoglycomyces albus]|uniref:Integral membrane protein n=1 Tax=Natronoglycomyces albus TaxID=2811108 RepID=A0A895XT97_9ACTN|nr:hypothetical protein [Natronoglycomyces albus]QSB05480.1 hypothetical protein JQS30_00605 [Natronoglycomyces albus]